MESRRRRSLIVVDDDVRDGILVTTPHELDLFNGESPDCFVAQFEFLVRFLHSDNIRPGGRAPPKFAQPANRIDRPSATVPSWAMRARAGAYCMWRMP